MSFFIFCFKVRVNCLVCLGKILEFLDKYLVIDEVLPVLAEIPTREPAVCMAILGQWLLEYRSYGLFQLRKSEHAV